MVTSSRCRHPRPLFPKSNGSADCEAEQGADDGADGELTPAPTMEPTPAPTVARFLHCLE